MLITGMKLVPAKGMPAYPVGSAEVTLHGFPPYESKFYSKDVEVGRIIAIRTVISGEEIEQDISTQLDPSTIEADKLTLYVTVNAHGTAKPSDVSLVLVDAEGKTKTVRFKDVDGEVVKYEVDLKPGLPLALLGLLAILVVAILLWQGKGI